ncbi:BTB/POZ domain-containing protein 8, partial [Stegodyphus mimosarum]
MSTDGISNSPITNMSNGTETTLSKLDKSKCLSGSMFPFYIDINNLPPASPTHKKEKKSSPSHTYMYIDASSPKRSRNALRRPPYLNSSYEEFFSEFESDYEYPKQMPLMKAQSTSQLDMYRGDFRANRGSDKHKKFRPQSCYMYVDLDSLKVDQTGKYSKGTLGKQEPMSVSMFINLNEEHNQPNEDDSDINHKDINVNSVLDSKSESQLKPQMKEYWALSDKVNGEHKRKLSDSSLADSMHHYEHNVNFQSLSKHNESRSASALDYQYVNTQENSLSHKRNIIPRKSHSAQRYSDGIYYDNLYQKKYAPDLCNSYENKIWNTAKNSYGKDLKHISQTIKVMQVYDKNEEPSGSCSDLGKISTCDKLFSSDKVKWKSTGDMGKTKSNKSDEEGGLLPMSPILRRKSQTKEIPKSAPPPVVVKASTKPQDIDAMTFPKSLKDVDEAQKISNKSTMDDTKPDLILCQSPSRKKLDRIDDSKSSSESSRLGSEGLFELCDLKDKNIDAMSRSGSSLMTISGGDSSSDKHVSHDPVKEKFTHSPLTLSVSCDFEDDSETVYSEVSDVSSSIGGISGVASLERRWREAQNLQIDPNSKNSRTARQMLEACSKLGEDLLKMFLDEIDTDITIEVEEKQIKAHRCILASRCKYFANLLRNTSTDKNSSTISLEGFSYPAVHFALCHIYSGAMNIPKDCNISELALLADMLHLDTLTDIIVFHLKMHFCHFFHRPCLQCTQGVVECLPLAAVCGLNDLRDKCIHWLGKHFTRTWPNKSFASLSEELRDLCYNVTVQLLAVDSVIDMTLNCDRLMTTLPQLKWTEPIFGMVTKLLQDCIHFMAQNFNQILNSEG